MSNDHLVAGLNALRRITVLVLAAMCTVALFTTESIAQTTGPVVIEGEALLGAAQASDGQVVRQEMAGFGNGWGGNAQMFWGARQPGAKLQLSPNLPASGLYEVRIIFTVAPDFGVAGIQLGGHDLASFDAYNSGVALREVVLGQLQLTAGSQPLQLRVTGKNELSAGYFLGIDRVEFYPLSAEITQSPSRVPSARAPAVSPPPPSPPAAPESSLSSPPPSAAPPAALDDAGRN